MTFSARDLTGKRFGKWVVLERAENRGSHPHWLCRCDCGTTRSVQAGSLTANDTLSCGCDRFRRFRGMRTKHPAEWKAIINARRRCGEPSNWEYHRYGGRGIRVCDRWSDNYAGFIAFVEDMGPKPSPRHTLDRIDNDGDYEPGNCRWSTQREQQNNKSNNHFISAFGATATAAEWSRAAGIKYGTLIRRLHRGWPPEAALTTDILRGSQNLNWLLKKKAA